MNAMKRKARYRIGIDARMYRKAIGGIGRYTRELLHNLLPMDPDNDYVIFLTQADMAEWDIDFPNVKPVVTDVIHFDPVREQTVFLKQLNAEKLDLVHFLNFNHPLLYTKPFVVTLHDLTMFLFPVHGTKKPNIVKKVGFNLLFRQAMRYAKKVIAVSEYSAFDAEKVLKVPHAKMEVVYHGGPESLRFLPGSRDMAQKYLGTRDPYFLFVSQWRPHKGILTLLEAFDLFKKETGLPHKLVLVGNPEATTPEVRHALVTMPSASEVVAPGFAPEEVLPALYHYATAHILPSEYEGFGMSVLEAYTYETPVIAANNSSIPEVVGNAGLLFETRNARQLADHMKHIAEDASLREKLLAKAPEQVEKFTWKHAAERTLSVYHSVLEKKR